MDAVLGKQMVTESGGRTTIDMAASTMGIAVGAGDETRTRDPLLGKQMCAVLSLMEAPDALIGSSWPSASRGRGPLLPDDSQATV